MAEVGSGRPRSRGEEELGSPGDGDGGVVARNAPSLRTGVNSHVVERLAEPRLELASCRLRQRPRIRCRLSWETSLLLLSNVRELVREQPLAVLPTRVEAARC